MKHELTFHIIALGHPYGLGATINIVMDPEHSFVKVSGPPDAAATDIANFLAEAVKEAAEKFTQADQESAFAKMSRHLKPVE